MARMRSSFCICVERIPNCRAIARISFMFGMTHLLDSSALLRAAARRLWTVYTLGRGLSNPVQFRARRLPNPVAGRLPFDRRGPASQNEVHPLFPVPEVPA
jgi:hypothetical protein